MILCDVNVFLYAHKTGTHRHSEYKRWLEAQLVGEAPFGVSELVLSAFLRIATHPRIFDPPSTIQEACAFAEQVLGAPSVVRVRPGSRHWAIFQRLLRETSATGNLVPDAYFAALAIESGCEWVTTDGDYARFEGLRWRRPLDRPSPGGD